LETIEIFYFIIEQPIQEPEIRIYVEYDNSVVKEVDLERCLRPYLSMMMMMNIIVLLAKFIGPY